jgi:hypothetical protein
MRQEQVKELLIQSLEHERILVRVFQQLSLDPNEDSPGRRVVKLLGAALVDAHADRAPSRKPRGGGVGGLRVCRACRNKRSC